ncbi:MAG: aryl-sulfate sulfotransferase [Bacteroidales bacterium]|nr:aryl-sulfate sulfotransferase [Bacteroidales bacterium]
MNRILIIIVSLFWVLQLWGQKPKFAELQYVSPKPGSKFIMPGNNIALRHGQPLETKSISSSLLEVKNAAGERIEGKIKLSTDQKTLIYKPHNPFPLGETIHVKLNNGLKTISDLNIRPAQFEFTITSKIVQPPEGFNPGSYNPDVRILSEKENIINSKENNLPEGFPYININVSNNPPESEYYFIAPWTHNHSTDPFMIITDPSGIPVFYRKAEASIFDFKVQPNGLLSFAKFDQHYKNILMDSAFREIDYFQIGNGYTQTDAHDFQLIENGHAFVLGVDWQQYGMDTVVPGGNPVAMVCGFIVQEQDIDKNVIFQWRSWDHFLITDAGPQIDLTSYLVDYVHGNAVEVESDTSILISSRSMDEITKIHRNSGEIIWRFGGKQNQFNVQNDTLGFTMQHDCRRLPNNHITLFDNGCMHPEPKFSSALEYELDENNFEAVLIRRLRNDPDIYGSAMGNAQWKDDSAVIIGWGNGVPGITEFSLDGEKNMEIEFQGVSYRAFRFPWKTNYFSTDVDSLQFEISLPDSMIQEIEIYNNNEFEIEITSIYNINSFFSSAIEFPVIVPAAGSIPLYIKFKPDTAGTYSDVLTINSDINTDTLVQRIAQQVHLIGNATEGQNVTNQLIQLDVEIFPNPVSDKVNIQMRDDHALSKVSIYNHAGQRFANVMFDSVSDCLIDISDLTSGLYFIKIETIDNQIGMFKIIKI